MLAHWGPLVTCHVSCCCYLAAACAGHQQCCISSLTSRFERPEVSQTVVQSDNVTLQRPSREGSPWLSQPGVLLYIMLNHKSRATWPSKATLACIIRLNSVHILGPCQDSGSTKSRAKSTRPVTTTGWCHACYLLQSSITNRQLGGL